MTTRKSAAAPAAKKGSTAAPKAKKAPAAPEKKAAPAPAKKAVSAPALKTPAKAPAKRVAARVPAVKSPGREAMLARVESVRLAQREEGHFDCFGRAAQGYCDQGVCSYHDECLSISRLLHEV